VHALGTMAGGAIVLAYNISNFSHCPIATMKLCRDSDPCAGPHSWCRTAARMHVNLYRNYQGVVKLNPSYFSKPPQLREKFDLGFRPDPSYDFHTQNCLQIAQKHLFALIVYMVIILYITHFISGDTWMCASLMLRRGRSVRWSVCP